MTLKSPKVAVVGRDGTDRMFLKRGWRLVELLGGETPDLIQFTGGEDVDPSLYKHAKHNSTRSNPRRDAAESQIYYSLLGKVAFAGICRGGQLLNVLNGGTLYQHVDNHYSDHIAFDHVSGREIVVTSTHHQMMIPGEGAQLLMTASKSNSRWLEQSLQLVDKENGEVDTEAVFYASSRSLCYQPHPEYLEIGSDCQEIYFDYIKNLLNIG